MVNLNTMDNEKKQYSRIHTFLGETNFSPLYLQESMDLSQNSLTIQNSDI